MNDPTTAPGYGNIWRAYDQMEQRLSAPLSERMLELAGLAPGKRVLDLATGRGEPAIPAAQRVLPHGSVLGIDIDYSVLQIAREKAIRQGIHNVDFVVDDMENLGSLRRGSFDIALARWGLMYLHHPKRALAATRRLMVAGGRLVAAVWTAPERASFFTLPRVTLAKFAGDTPTDDNVPGTFYYADLERLSDDLESAGFTIKHTELIEIDVMEARSDNELLAWARTFGMARQLQALPARVHAQWEQELLAAAEPLRGTDGLLRLGGTSLVVVAD